MTLPERVGQLSFPEARTMKRVTALLALLLGLALAAAARADNETRPAIKTGGDFDVEVVKDLAYYDGPDADPVKHKLDLYLPKEQKDFPVLFFIHGGGWKSGDRSLYGALGRLFAKNGLGTVVISYRLSPKVQHPAHIQDVAKAFAWTCQNIGKYGGKVDEIFVSGHSAGGHLAALLATNESYLKAEKLSPANIKGVIPLSGVYMVTPNLFKAFPDDEQEAKNASPLEHVKEGEPPFLIIYADKDFPTCDKLSEKFCTALKGCKCEATMLEVKERNHITIIVRMAGEGDPTTQAMLEFIAKHSGLKLMVKEEKKEK
jgi:acetyl esterase/lipase